MSARSIMKASSGGGANVDSSTAVAPIERHAEQRGDGLGPVAHQDPDARARADRRAASRPRAIALALAPQVGVGPPHGLAAAQRVVEHERLVGAEPLGDLVEEPAHRQRPDARVPRRAAARGTSSRDALRRARRGRRSRRAGWRRPARWRCARRSTAGGARAGPCG